jgi:FMN phosphatase YigB (HAD superfamily)
MRVYSLPENPQALLFDIDGTLYDSPEYQRSQIEGQIARFAESRGCSLAEARSLLDTFAAEYARDHSGAKTSLGNSLAHFGVSIQESVRWREELIDPFAYLKPDPELRASLELAVSRYSLACVTNNPSVVGRRSLEALGVADLIPIVVGLDSCLESKPSPAPFLKALFLIGKEAKDCISIGDRYDVDIEPALSLGMGGLLINSCSEIYINKEIFFIDKIAKNAEKSNRLG